MSSVAAPRKPLAELAEREFLEDLVRLPTISARGTRSRAPRAIARARTPALILFFASQHRTGKQSARVVAIRTENSKTRVGKTRFCFSSVSRRRDREAVSPRGSSARRERFSYRRPRRATRDQAIVRRGDLARSKNAFRRSLTSVARIRLRHDKNKKIGILPETSRRRRRPSGRGGSSGRPLRRVRRRGARRGRRGVGRLGRRRGGCPKNLRRAPRRVRRRAPGGFFAHRCFARSGSA
jgi:hypothetical protein